MKRGRVGLRSCLEEVPGWGNRAGVRYLAQSVLSITQQTFEAAVAFARCHILSLGFFLASRAYENPDCRERRLGCSSDSLPVES